jgi:hypothetical protein
VKAIRKSALLKGESVMKRIIAAALLAVSTFSASSIFAQTRALKADVPFGFSVGGAQLPADTYLITSVSSGIVMIRNAKGGPSAMVTTLPGESRPTGSNKLVFARYGEQYFLHRIVCSAGVGVNVDIPTSKQEKKIRSERSTLDRGDLAVLELK